MFYHLKVSYYSHMGGRHIIHSYSYVAYVVIYMYILAFVLCQSYIGDKGVLKFILFNHVPINPSTITATAKMPVGKP